MNELFCCDKCEKLSKNLIVRIEHGIKFSVCSLCDKELEKLPPSTLWEMTRQKDMQKLDSQEVRNVRREKKQNCKES
jgi:hypothetical protein